jgi:hypothetical protein
LSSAGLKTRLRALSSAPSVGLAIEGGRVSSTLGTGSGILTKAAARRGPPPVRFCSECGELVEGRARVSCGSSRYRDARLKHENPEAYAKREAAKVERRRERRREAAKAA